MSLIQTSKRGAPIKSLSDDKRRRESMITRRIAEYQRITSSELLGVIGRDGVNLELLGDRVARAQAKGLNKVLLTAENHMLTALSGVTKDADGSDLDNFATRFSVSLPAEIPFALSNAGTKVRALCADVVRKMTRASKGAMSLGATVRGVCGDQFFDDLISHAEVKQTYLNQQAANELRTGYAFGSLVYGGIEFVNYRGTDDGTTVGIATDKCRFFPVGADDTFNWVQSPGEKFANLGSEGRPFYSWMVEDPNDEWIDVYVAAYPLFVCTRPGVLFSARAGA